MKIQGTLMFRMVKKLRGLKGEFKQLDKEQFSDIENLTHIVEMSLLHYQNLLVQDHLNEEACVVERACALELVQLLKPRESYLRQKAKTECIKTRRARNKVYQMKDIYGTLCSFPEEIIKGAFEEYYKSLLGTDDLVSAINGRVVRDGKCLTASHCSLLIPPLTDEEIKIFMFDISGNKAPRPDWYSIQFFNDAWHIVGKDVTNAIRSVFNSRALLKQCNTTIITLVPKVDVLEFVL
ncbi:uncharacterized protein LOC141590148 [Silene latifolia]|uniref:uncharacterized protein LOC141590148 n=1 Tax=Silene latifolia TaxID=37657 RepID=UPI003D772989